MVVPINRKKKKQILTMAHMADDIPNGHESMGKLGKFMGKR
jgi:hypothetical protein